MSPAGTFTSKVSVRRTSMPSGPVTRTASVVRPDLVGLELEGLALALAGARCVTVRSKPGCAGCAGLRLVLAGDRVGAGRAFDVVHGQLEARLVAQREEARAGDRQRHRIAHDHVLGRRSRPCRRSRPPP